MTAKPKWVIGKWFPLPDADKRVMKYWRRGDRYDNTGTWVEVDELATVTTWPTKKAAHEAFRMHGPRLNRFPGSVDEIRVLKLSDVTTVQLPAEMVETLLNEEAAAITAKRSGHDNRSAKIEARQAWAAEQQIEPGYRALDQDIRAMAKTIATDLVEFGRLIERAKTEHLWERLGFKSWTAYIADVVGRNMKVLPVEDRRQIVAFLDDEGMSQRAIAAAVGVSQKTVDRDLDELSHDDSVADDDDELAPVLTIVKERRTGLDGKSRPAHPQERTRTPLPRTIAMRKAHASLATIEGAVGQLEEAITELAEAGGLDGKYAFAERLDAIGDRLLKVEDKLAEGES